MKELDIIRTQFLTDDIDPEDRIENERILQEWEQGLSRNRAYEEWRQSDITREVIQQARESYKEFSMTLAHNRSLTNEQRVSLWGKQDACVFLLSLVDRNSQEALAQIHNEIKKAINAT